MEMKKRGKIMLSLVWYDFLIFLCADVTAAFLLRGVRNPADSGWERLIVQSICVFAVIQLTRSLGNVYKQIWRYGGIQSYLRLILADFIACLINLVIAVLLPRRSFSFVMLTALSSLNALGCVTARMLYRYAYKYYGRDGRKGVVLRWLLNVFAHGRIDTDRAAEGEKIPVAIIGAGSVGVYLADELINDPKSRYVPLCFIDVNPDKIQRSIHDIPVWDEGASTTERMRKMLVQEVVFTVQNMDADQKLKLIELYKKAGFRIKVYDYPILHTPGSKRQLREFDIEDLLMREPKDFLNEETKAYYRDKTILITGGGGSIGSELCRQLAKMQPRQLIVLDIYENAAYELQQELQFNYKGQLNVHIEIVSITNMTGLTRVFERYHPDICINAAAHKHVPLMEHNCIEAVENNIFGTLNVIRCCEKYGCGRFMMVSTDKAVNPTNVMGATKRFCEMIMQAYSTRGIVQCSATRFGNVLGSAGSVIPLFKRQIAAGGPITITDKRIIRYFMTIPEASQLVLTSGAIAQNGEIFVLDMGNPVRIMDLAANMITLSGVEGIEIVEIGLRPGEKLYEELLMDREGLERTENNLIFIDHETPVSMQNLEEKLEALRNACRNDSDDGVRDALKRVVPTYRNPEYYNKTVSE